MNHLLIGASFLLLAVSISADEGGAEKIHELVPANLHDWTIEFTELGNRGAKQSITVDDSGRINLAYGSQAKESGKLHRDETNMLFTATRDIFNRYRLRELRGKTHDWELFIKIQSKSGPALRLQLDPEHFGQLGISESLNLALKILRKHVATWFSASSYDPMLVLGTPLEPLPTNRLPEDQTKWVLFIFDGNAADKGFRHRVSIGEEQIQLSLTKDRIPATPADARIRHAVAGKILNRAGLLGATQQHADAPKRFDLAIWNGSGITFTCDRQTLIDTGVLDELDAWVKDINRRFEAAGFQERFVPPWTE